MMQFNIFSKSNNFKHFWMKNRQKILEIYLSSALLRSLKELIE